MRVLKAEVVSRNEVDGVVTLGFFAPRDSMATEYLLMLRARGDGPADEGVYVELDDQIHSGYGLVQSYIAGPGRLDVQLAKPLGTPPETLISVFYPDSPENALSVERAVKRVLG